MYRVAICLINDSIFFTFQLYRLMICIALRYIDLYHVAYQKCIVITELYRPAIRNLYHPAIRKPRKKLPYFPNREKSQPRFSLGLCIASSKRLLKSFCKRHSVFCSSRKFSISFCKSSLFSFSCCSNVS
jgi:hypothetical protein